MFENTRRYILPTKTNNGNKIEHTQQIIVAVSAQKRVTYAY